jgi:hypothetical protein
MLVSLLMFCNTTFPKSSTSIKFLYIQPTKTNEAPNHMSAPTPRDQQANSRFLTLEVQSVTLGHCLFFCLVIDLGGVWACV